MKGVLPWLVHWAFRARKRDFCSAFAALVGPVYFFLTVHYFNSVVPFAQQAVQAAVLGRLSLSLVSVSDLASPLIIFNLLVDDELGGRGGRRGES
jgi:hypothetical protein